MSWAIKYRKEFTDILGLDWKIEIEEDAYAGSVIVIPESTDSPLNIQYLANSDELFDTPIKGSKADLTIYANSNFQWVDLYTYQDQHFRMSIYYNSTLYWRGYVLSDNYQEPYDTPDYAVTVSATDGLGILKNYLYASSDVVSGGTETITYYNGRRLESQVILDILGKIGITEFKEYINIYATGMNSSVNDSPMDQLYIDVDVFKDQNCYDVLNSVLIKYNAVIRQHLGEYFIYRPTELKSIVYGRHFTGATTQTSLSYSPDQFISRSTVTDLRDVNGGTLMIQGPSKKITCTQDYGNKESWIDNYKFEKTSFHFGPPYTVDNWSKSAGMLPPDIRPSLDGDDGVVFLCHDNYTYTKYLYQDFGIYIVTTSDVIDFEFEYQWLNEEGATVTGQSITFAVFSGDLSHSLQEDDATYCSWITGATPIGIIEDVPDGHGEWNTWSRKINGLPLSGTYRIIFFAPSASHPVIYTGIRNVKFYSTSDTITINKRKHRGPFPKLAKWILGTSDNIIKYIDNPEVIQNIYNPVCTPTSGKELNYDYTLGDVPKISSPTNKADTNIDNIIEQFGGSLAVAIRDTLTVAATNFVTNHAADYASYVIVTSSANVLYFTAGTAGSGFSSTAISNLTGSLSGTVAHPTPNSLGVSRSDQIAISGNSGTCNLMCSTLAELMTWNVAGVYQTCEDFVTSWYATYYAQNILLQHITSNVLAFSSLLPGGDFTGSTIVIPLTGTLGGTVTQNNPAASPAVKQIDTITLTGINGTANITCHAVTKSIIINETIAYTTTWNRRGLTDNKPLLSIIGDELATQYSRPKHFISLPIMEDNTINNTPHVNLLGNIQDEINQVSAVNRVFAFNKGEFNVRDREFMIYINEII